MSQLPYTMAGIFDQSQGAQPSQSQQQQMSPYLQAQMSSGQSGDNPMADPALMAALAGNYMFAGGGYVDRPHIAVVGEGDAPEYVIPTDPKYHGRAKKLLKQASKAVRKRKPVVQSGTFKKPAGVPRMAAGGFVPAPHDIYQGYAPQTGGFAYQQPQNPLNATGYGRPQGYGAVGPLQASIAMSHGQQNPGLAQMVMGAIQNPQATYPKSNPYAMQGILLKTPGLMSQIAPTLRPAPQANRPGSGAMVNGSVPGGGMSYRHYAMGGVMGNQPLITMHGNGNGSFGSPLTFQGGMQGFLGGGPVHVSTGDWMHGGPINTPGQGPMGGMGGGNAALSAPGSYFGGANSSSPMGSFGSPMTLPGGQNAFLAPGMAGVHVTPSAHPFTSPVNNGGFQGGTPGGLPHGISGMMPPRPIQRPVFGGGVQPVQPVHPVVPVQSLAKPIARPFARTPRMADGGVLAQTSRAGVRGTAPGGGITSRPAANVTGAAPPAANVTGAAGNSAGNYNINGSLTLPNTSGGVAAGINALGAGYGMNLGALASGYNDAYAGALGLNQQIYDKSLAGFQQTMGNQIAAQKGISGIYDNAQNAVMNILGQGGTPWGIAQPAATAIGDVYAQQQGAAQQNLVNSGLGGSTVLPSVQRGIGLDAAKAYGALGSNLAQTYAGYTEQNKLAKAGYLNQANQQNTALSQAQLAFMNSVQAPYPNAQAYGQIAQQAGAAQQAQHTLNTSNQQFADQLKLQQQGLAQQGALGAAGLGVQAQGNKLNALQGLANKAGNPYAGMSSGQPGMSNPYIGMGGRGFGGLNRPPSSNDLGGQAIDQAQAIDQGNQNAANNLGGQAIDQAMAIDANNPQNFADQGEGAEVNNPANLLDQNGNPINWGNGQQLDAQQAAAFQNQVLLNMNDEDLGNMFGIFDPQLLGSFRSLLQSGLSYDQAITLLGGG